MDLRAICLLGAPASGKSTLAQQLALRFDAVIFQLGPAVERIAERRPEIAAAARRTTDPLGWIDDDAVALVVRHAAAEWGRRTVILDNFPGRPSQVQMLTAVRPADRILAVRLDADRDELLRRAGARRLCSRCNVSYPSIAACPACGAALVRRIDDESPILDSRLERYDAYRDDVHAELAAHGIQVVSVADLKLLCR